LRRPHPRNAGRRSSFIPVALLVLGVGALAANCSQSDTVLLVHVTASAAPLDGIQQLHTTLRVGGQTHVIDVPDAPVAIALPTSFTVQLARSFTGDLSVNVDARDAGGVTIASGSQTVSPLQVGQQNELTIDLAPGAVPDAGMDGPPNTTGTGGLTGTGGATATGGAIGSGGATAGGGGATAGSSGAGGNTATGGSAGAGARGGAGGHGGTVGTGGHAGGASGSGGRAATGGMVGSGGAASGGSGGMTASGGAPGSGGMATGGSDAGGSAGGAGGDAGGAAGS